MTILHVVIGGNISQDYKLNLQSTVENSTAKGSNIVTLFELEGLIVKALYPYITKLEYPNHAEDKLLAEIGGWANFAS